MEAFDFTKLSKEDQSEYIEVAKLMFGETVVFVSTGEPMYMNKDGTRNPTHQFVLDMMRVKANVN